MIATSSSEGSRAEAERQLAASAARHREVVASMQEPNRPQAGQHVAAKSVGRAVQLVSYGLKRAAALRFTPRRHGLLLTRDERASHDRRAAARRLPRSTFPRYPLGRVWRSRTS